MKLSTTVLALFLSVTSLVAQSTVPEGLNYQGFLTDAAGDPIGQGTAVTRTLAFRLYTGAEGGEPIWGEQQLVSVFNGNFSVILGNGVAIDSAIPSGSAVLTEQLSDPPSASLFFGVTEQGLAEFTPRQQLLAGAFAQRAKVAEVALNADTATLATTATLAVNSTNAVNAENAVNAVNAENAENAENAVTAQTSTRANSVNDGATLNVGIPIADRIRIDGNTLELRQSNTLFTRISGFETNITGFGSTTTIRSNGLTTTSDRNAKKDISETQVDLSLIHI